MTDTPKPLTKADLAQFSGSETVFRHSLMRHIRYTEGVQFVAERAGAYWLVDDIAFGQATIAELKDEEFQVWKLTVRPDQTATLVCEDGNDRVIISKELTFTDFPLPEFALWFTDNTLLLPSEY
jgi:hypothetical protein